MTTYECRSEAPGFHVDRKEFFSDPSEPEPLELIDYLYGIDGDYAIDLLCEADPVDIAKLIRGIVLNDREDIESSVRDIRGPIKDHLTKIIEAKNESI